MKCEGRRVLFAFEPLPSQTPDVNVSRCMRHIIAFSKTNGTSTIHKCIVYPVCYEESVSLFRQKAIVGCMPSGSIGSTVVTVNSFGGGISRYSLMQTAGAQIYTLQSPEG